jgi:hypothetical protein
MWYVVCVSVIVYEHNLILQIKLYYIRILSKLYKNHDDLAETLQIQTSEQ